MNWWLFCIFIALMMISYRIHEVANALEGMK